MPRTGSTRSAGPTRSASAVGFPECPHVSLWGCHPIRQASAVREPASGAAHARRAPARQPAARRHHFWWCARTTRAIRQRGGGCRGHRSGDGHPAVDFHAPRHRPHHAFSLRARQDAHEEHVPPATKSNASDHNAYGDARFKAIWPSIRNQDVAYHIDLLTAHFVQNPDWFTWWGLEPSATPFGTGPACTGTLDRTLGNSIRAEFPS